MKSTTTAKAKAKAKVAAKPKPKVPSRPKSAPKGPRQADKFASHAAYFAQAAPEGRRRLKAIQRNVQALLPDAVACISYNMPAFRAGRVFFYFAAFKTHIGVYPPVKADKPLIDALRPYRNDKGNLAFPLEEPLPLELIGRVALALHHEYGKA